MERHYKDNNTLFGIPLKVRKKVKIHSGLIIYCYLSIGYVFQHRVRFSDLRLDAMLSVR